MKKYSLKSYKIYYSATWYPRLVDDYCLLDGNLKEYVQSKLIKLKQNDKIKFHPKCKIPKTTDLFKRCLKLSSADVGIIPDCCLDNIFYGDVKYKYINHEHQLILYFRQEINENDIIRLKNKLNIKGDLIFEKIPEDWKIYNNKNNLIDFIIDAKNLAYEEDVAQVIVTSKPPITIEKINSLCSLISSNDKDTRILGMQALAELNYIEYKNIARYILSKAYGGWYNQLAMFNSTAVKYMIKYVDPYTKLRITECSEKEFPIIKSIVEQYMQNSIEFAMLDICPDSSVKINYNIDIIK